MKGKAIFHVGLSVTVDFYLILLNFLPCFRQLIQAVFWKTLCGGIHLGIILKRK